MTEDTTEKTEKIQLEGIVEKDKVKLFDERAIEEFYNSSYIGTLEENNEHQPVLVFNSI